MKKFLFLLLFESIYVYSFGINCDKLTEKFNQQIDYCVQTGDYSNIYDIWVKLYNSQDCSNYKPYKFYKYAGPILKWRIDDIVFNNKSYNYGEIKVLFKCLMDIRDYQFSIASLSDQCNILSQKAFDFYDYGYDAGEPDILSSPYKWLRYSIDNGGTNNYSRTYDLFYEILKQKYEKKEITFNEFTSGYHLLSENMPKGDSKNKIENEYRAISKKLGNPDYHYEISDKEFNDNIDHLIIDYYYPDREASGFCPDYQCIQAYREREFYEYGYYLLLPGPLKRGMSPYEWERTVRKYTSLDYLGGSATTGESQLQPLDSNKRIGESGTYYKAPKNLCYGKITTASGIFEGYFYYPEDFVYGNLYDKSGVLISKWEWGNNTTAHNKQLLQEKILKETAERENQERLLSFIRENLAGSTYIGGGINPFGKNHISYKFMFLPKNQVRVICKYVPLTSPSSETEREVVRFYEKKYNYDIVVSYTVYNKTVTIGEKGFDIEFEDEDTFTLQDVKFHRIKK